MKRWWIWVLAGMMVAGRLEAGGKPQISVRIHAESHEREGESFVTQVELAEPKKKIHIKKVPVVSERNIAGILPFSSADGSLGCTFLLDPDGAQKIEEHTTGARDMIVVALVNGRVACAMRVDRRITDGVITVASGFLPEEVLALQALHPTLGKEKEFKKQKKEALASLAKRAKAQKQSAPDKPKAE